MNKVVKRARKTLLEVIDETEQKMALKTSRKKTIRKYSVSELNELIKKARECFFDYCCLVAPDFYKPERKYLKEICDDLQSFYEDNKSKIDVLIMSIPPRHGKSRTACLFAQWVFGKNSEEKIMTGSYNEMLSTTFSKNVRNTIAEIKVDPSKIVYSDIFPYTKIKQGESAAHYWSLEGEYSSYLATSPTGTSTGFGCSLMMIDDIVKSAYEAFNETILEGHWSWFTNTMLSRLEQGGKIIIIMTRWASKDLAGRAIKHFGKKAKVITMKAMQDDGTMLCDDVLSKESYLAKISAMGKDIASANYQQEPIDLKGKLYTSFKTYIELPKDERGNLLFTEIRNYTDTADQGDDYLCSIDYGVYNGEAYILNIIYTKDGMEITEPATAKMLHDDNVSDADIESNNGGRGFARSVERILKEKLRSNRTKVNSFHQSKNKQSRIISNATWVMNHIYFPVNWMDRFPDYYDSMAKYQKEGKNAHDDAQDATTGIAEKLGQGDIFSFE